MSLPLDLIFEILTFFFLIAVTLAISNLVEHFSSQRRRLGQGTAPRFQLASHQFQSHTPLVKGWNVSSPFLLWVQSSTSIGDSKVRQKLVGELADAGFDHPAAPVWYVILRFSLAIGLPLVFLLGNGLTANPSTGSRLIFLTLLLCGVGLLAPSIIISRRASARRAQLEREFPDALDLMVVCVEAGLSLEASFVRVGDEIGESHPRISDEFARVSAELRAGQGLTEALRAMGDRSGVSGIKAFTALVIQTEALGVSVAQTLRTYSVEMRETRFFKAEEKAMRIPVLMTIPLVICILPVIITAAMLPVIIDIMRTVVPALTAHHGGGIAKMTNVNVRHGLIATVSIISLVSCSSVQDKVTPTSNQIASTTSNATVNKDEGYYQGAVRAIIGGDYASALDYLQAARQVQANDVRVLNAFGVVYDKLGRFDLSARYYAQALAVSPTSPIVAKNLAYSGVLQKMTSSVPLRPETARNATPPVTVASQSPAATQAGSSVSSSGLIHDMGGPAQVAQAKASDAKSPATVTSKLPAAIQVASNISAPDPVRDMVGPAQMAQTKVADAKAPAMATSKSPAAIQVGSSIPHPDLVPSMDVPEHGTSPKTVHEAMPAMVASQAQAVIQSASSVSSPILDNDMGGPAQMAQTKAPEAKAHVMLVSQSPAAIQAAPSISSPTLDYDMGGSAHMAPTNAAGAKAPAMVASQSPAAIQAAPSISSPTKDHDMGGSAQMAQTNAAEAKAPAIVASQSPAAIHVASSVSPPDLARNTGVPMRVTPTKMVHAAMAVMPASRLPAAIQTTLKNRPVDIPRYVALPEQSTQAGITHVVVRIPAPEVAPTQRAHGLTGHPLAVVNATGRSDMAEPVRRRLVQLGWSAPHWAATEIPNQQYTTIRYAEPDAGVAHALARTLPFPVHLATCADHCKGIVLTVGTNYLGWKPVFARLLRWIL